jgi:hypothetical protein
MAADQPGRGGAFEGPEGLLAVLDEDVADRLAAASSMTTSASTKSSPSRAATKRRRWSCPRRADRS